MAVGSLRQMRQVSAVLESMEERREVGAGVRPSEVLGGVSAVVEGEASAAMEGEVSAMLAVEDNR